MNLARSTPFQRVLFSQLKELKRLAPQAMGQESLVGTWPSPSSSRLLNASHWCSQLKDEGSDRPGD